MQIIQFLKNWTLPVAIVVGTLCYLTFYFVPALDAAGEAMGSFFDIFFPVCVFFTLLVTFCKVDFHQMRLHRWHLTLFLGQLCLVALNIGIILWWCESDNDRILWESVLTCIIAPCAAAAPVVTGKLGGNISTMTTYTLFSSLVASLLIPAAFPILEPTEGVSFIVAFFAILEKLCVVLVLPLLMAYVIRHHLHSLHQKIVSKPNLGFYFWAVSLSITTGITVKNIVHCEAGVGFLVMIALMSLAVCIVHFVIGRAIGSFYGEKINAGQGMFQKNTALAIWVSYMYLHPIASIGAGCYVLWQNVINSMEIKLHETKPEYLH